MSPNIIEVSSLSKNFVDVEAIKEISLSVPKGSIYGFLGRNGSGKTTTIKILMGMTFPSSGEARVFGGNPNDHDEGVAIRRRVGFVSEEKRLYCGMKVEQLIHFTRSFYPSWDRESEANLLRLFELPLNRKVSRLSKGMRTRLALLLALARGAELLILDEPSSGLDPFMAEAVLRNLVSLTASRGVTPFFSTHHIDEVEQICDHVCMIDDGEVVVDGTIDGLKERYQRIHLVFKDHVPRQVRELAGLEPEVTGGRTLSVLAKNNVSEIVEKAKRYQAVSVDVSPVTLKDIFLDQVHDNVSGA